MIPRHDRNGGDFFAALIGRVQICDGPIDMPADKQYWEAGDCRLYPGEGEFPLAEIFDAIPADIVVGVEVPRSPDVENGVSFAEIAKRCHDSARITLQSSKGRH